MFRDPPNPGETHTNTRKIRGYYPDLRPEDANKEDHPNPYIQKLREKLWTPELLRAFSRGSHTYEPRSGYRPGLQELSWQQQVKWGEYLVRKLEPYDTDVRRACAYFDSK